MHEDVDTYYRYLWHQIAALDDQQAYRKLFDALAGPLIRWSQVYVKQYEVAEEIVSDVFMWMWQQRSRLGSIRQVRLYLYQAVKNRSLNYLRTIHSRTEFEDIASFEGTVIPAIQFNADDPEQILLNNELRRHMEKAIASLPARCRLIFRLVKDDGMHYKEVAELLQISVKTVETQMGIAFRRLAEAIQPVVSPR
ncbi:RNA polymerase sigma-70 factor (ECF subfamily) [Thermoflavifilum aggregans]|uniref:RNA polymerase sigma-70 factor (ECF subfamily) n=1 Tax=Thermoflavifilum aggregans TaxID=454188 RepID=A0A2M9CRF1_9BACT|nr:RNA polymerase sigma-70 factor [Thermoflavifilum aggregans]PJJ74469.1 RNA polymerase sigma-70 factor (ECF subfamily) [Thermoflavifilum aggregans]